MSAPRLVLFFFLSLLGTSPLGAQDFKPPPGKLPGEDALKLIQAKTTHLGAMIHQLRKLGLRDPALADVAVYHQAALNIVAFEEFFHKDSAAWTLDVLDRGALRAHQLAAGDLPWLQARGIAMVRGFRSRIDGSVQPYAYTLPKLYGKDPGKKWHLEVWLHGRDKTLTEVKFLRNNHGEKEMDLDHVRIDIYGRGNNAYRWAGEVDVFEAIDHFLSSERALGRGHLVDANQVVLRGFSMGGAGAWHLGLHWPDRWCAVNPGAGFTTTHGYISGLPEKLPPHQEAVLRIYDAVDYAENAFNVPIHAYSGAKDKQKLAADLIEQRLLKLKIPMHHLIAPDLEHSFPPAWQAKVRARMNNDIEAGRPEYPGKVRFVTYTLKYPTCFWVEILGLNQHYEKATVKAERVEGGYVVQTANVRTLHLTLPEGVNGDQELDMDGQKMTIRPWLHPSGTYHLYLDRKESGWRPILPQRLITLRNQKPQKVQGMQGPIDDAFTEAFLCVRGTGKPWHGATQEYAEKTLERFQKEWARYLRGEVPVKSDLDVTSEDIASRNLILFGDPSSNALLGQVLDGLPLTWTEKAITLGGKTHAAGEHVPVLIYPNPLNPARYVVINSGHTFHAREFEGTNAQLYPRLGDWAILNLAEGKGSLDLPVAEAGLFDEYWQIRK